MKHNKKMIIILTGVSGSGKTTIANELAKHGFHKPINYTTRQPRNDEELDDYVFLTESQFEEKRQLLHFAEWTEYNGNHYAVSRFFCKEKHYVTIMEPKGRDMLEAWCIKNKHEYKKIFLEVDEDTAMDRLVARGETDEFIQKRSADFLSFLPDEDSAVVDGRQSVEDVVRDILDIINE